MTISETFLRNPSLIDLAFYIRNSFKDSDLTKNKGVIISLQCKELSSVID